MGLNILKNISEKVLKNIQKTTSVRAGEKSFEKITKSIKTCQERIVQNYAYRDYNVNPVKFNQVTGSDNFYKLIFLSKNKKYNGLISALERKFPYKDNETEYKRILTSFNENNRVLLQNFLENPDALKIAKAGNVFSSLSLNQLSFIMQLNRNQKDCVKYINDPYKVREFFDRLNKFIGVDSYNFAVKSQSPDSVRDFISVLSKGELFTQKGVKARLNRNVLDDLENIIHGKNYYPQFKAGESSFKIFETTKEGDALSIGEKMFFNNGKKLEELRISKQDYEKLFPAINRYYPVQGKIGDCYLVETLNALMQNPKTRGEIYKSFISSPKGIIVQLRGDGVGTPYLFKGFDTKGMHIKNENGLSILEQAFAVLKNKNSNVPLETAMKDIERSGTSVAMDSVQRAYKSEEYIHINGKPQQWIKDKLTELFRAKKLVYTSSVGDIERTFPNAHAIRLVGYSPISNTLVYSNPHYGGLLFDTQLDSRFFSGKWCGLHTHELLL